MSSTRRSRRDRPNSCGGERANRCASQRTFGPCGITHCTSHCNGLGAVLGRVRTYFVKSKSSFKLSYWGTAYWYYNKRPLSHKLKVVLSGATASPSPPHGGEVPSSGAGQTALTTSSEISSFLVASSRQPCLRRRAASVASLPPARSNCPRPPRPPPHQTPRPSWRPHAPRSSSAPF